MAEHDTVGFIPARFSSRRLPGKMLLSLDGKPMVQRTYEMALKSKALSKVYVLTDNQNIFDLIKGLGGDVLMTSESCPNGTSRVLEALNNYPELQKYPYSMIVQGDEPCVSPECIDKIMDVLKRDDKAPMATAVMPIDVLEAKDPSVVKCVFNHHNRALYFSRQPIPHHHPAAEGSFYGHLGFYAYRTEFLLKDYASLPSSPLQELEDLEQLALLDAGYPIAVTKVPRQVHGVNTETDLKRIEEYLCNQSTFS